MWFKTEEGFKHTTFCLHLQLFQKELLWQGCWQAMSQRGLIASTIQATTKCMKENVNTHAHTKPELQNKGEGFPLSCNPCQTLEETQSSDIHQKKKNNNNLNTN